MTEYSKNHLIKCLGEASSYKHTKLYIEQASRRQTQQFYEIISSSMIEIIKSLKINPITKLQTLRFFKDIFQSGNIDLLDSIDQKFEEHLLLVASYNKLSKELNRGENYFIDLEKRNNSKEIKQLGNSYVLLATQIIYNFAKAFPIDSDNQKSRFTSYYDHLVKQGVTFPQNNTYFKPQDLEKFKLNHKNWLKKYQINNNQQPKVNTDNTKLIQKNQKTIKPQNQQLNTTPKQIKNKQDPIIKKYQAEILKLKTQYNQKIKNIQQQNNNYSKQNKILQDATKDNQKIIAQSKIKIQQLQIELKQVKQKLNNSQLKNQQQQIQDDNQVCFILGQSKKKTQQPCFILQKQTKQFDNQLNQQNKLLQKQLEILKQQLKINKIKQEQKLNKTNEQLKQAYQNIKKLQVNKQEKEIQLKKIIEMQLKQKQNIIKTKQVNIVQKKQPQPIPLPKQVMNNQTKNNIIDADQKMMSLSYYFSQQKLNLENKNKLSNNQNKHFCKIQKKSLGKTEKSTLKLRQQMSANNLLVNTNQLYYKTFTQNKKWLQKKQNCFKLKKTAIQQKNDQQSKIITIIPFIEEYFDPIKIDQSFQFRSSCLKGLSSVFFFNEQIQARLINTKKGYLISIKNQTYNQIYVNINSLHQQIKIQFSIKQKLKRLLPSQYLDFPIQTNINDLNFRFPLIEILVYSKIQKVYVAPLPITLFSFCILTESDHHQFIDDNKNLNCFRSQKFSLNKQYKSISIAMQHLIFSNKGQRKQWKGKLEYKYIKQIQIFLKIVEQRRVCYLEVSYDPTNNLSQNFSKVIIQLIIFMLK